MNFMDSVVELRLYAYRIYVQFYWDSLLIFPSPYDVLNFNLVIFISLQFSMLVDFKKFYPHSTSNFENLNFQILYFKNLECAAQLDIKLFKA